MAYERMASETYVQMAIAGIDVSGKADKADTYTKSEVNSIVSGAVTGVFVVVAALPLSGEANKIYLVPSANGSTGNVRDEFMWVNGAWELIGSTQVDLSNYYDKSEANGTFVQKETGKGLFSGSYDDLDDKPDIPSVDDTLSQSGEAADAQAVGTALAQKASLSDLPYALVTPGKWEFSDGQAHTITGPAESIGGYNYYADSMYASQEFDTEADALDALMLDFTGFTATRPSLPGHLCDRAGNRVVVSGDTTLTLPAANPGYLRDFLVRLEISGSTVPTITFAAPTGETLTYETDGDEFPVPDEAGDWLYSFTETKAGVFAVALKSTTTVAQA